MLEIFLVYDSILNKFLYIVFCHWWNMQGYRFIEGSVGTNKISQTNDLAKIEFHAVFSCCLCQVDIVNKATKSKI